MKNKYWITFILLSVFYLSLTGSELVMRIMTDNEFAMMKRNIGTCREGQNYNVLIDGHGTGLKPPTEEYWQNIRNRPVVVERVISNNDRDRSSVDNSTDNWFPPIGNQDGEGSCVAWACGYYTKTYQEALEHSWDLSGCSWVGGYYGNPQAANQDMIFSPDFIYHQVNGGTDTGSWYDDSITLLSEIGCCSWEKMPYDPHDSTTWPDEDAWRQAPLYRSANSINYLYTLSDPALDDLKQILDDQNLTIISLNASYYSALTADDLWTIDNYTSYPWETNHANTIVGYDDNYGPYTEDGNPNTYGAFKVANSWGINSWENVADGFYYISYECMKQKILYTMFYDNSAGYEPEIVSVFQIDHTKRGECQITLGIGDTASPLFSKRFDDYTLNGGDQPFPANDIILDISEFNSYITGPPDNFFIEIYDGNSTTTGTLNSFSIEFYDDYSAGSPLQTYTSNDTPVNTTNSADVYAEILTSALSAPENITVQVVGNTLYLGWDPVSGAAAYSVYSSDDPYLDILLWTTEISGLVSTNWSETISADKKYYCVTASD
ncbi:MAG: C1 family peptidase [Candidatus Cloacimonetes bacterium]|nr:C1 family peptidase [Candidatus Cloacimonadota bacterium]